jgi:hypothetical protein
MAQPQYVYELNTLSIVIQFENNVFKKYPMHIALVGSEVLSGSLGDAKAKTIGCSARSLCGRCPAP